jgi:hypothetical protein
MRVSSHFRLKKHMNNAYLFLKHGLCQHFLLDQALCVRKSLQCVLRLPIMLLRRL